MSPYAWPGVYHPLRCSLHKVTLKLIKFLVQIISGIPQPMFQVIGPLYSETWFDLKGRTTATMLLSVGSSLITIDPKCTIDFHYRQQTHWDLPSHK